MASAGNPLVAPGSTRHEMASLVVFDTETSAMGGCHSGQKITELCFVSVQTREITGMNPARAVNKLRLCLNPGCVLPTEIIDFTGLCDDHLQQMPIFRNAAPLISGFLACQPRPLCIVAHNGNGFDFPLLQAELRAADQLLPADPGILCADSLEAFRMLDGLPAVRQRNETVSYKLGEIYCRVFGNPPDAAHTAEDDCNTLLRLILNRATDFIEWLDEHARPLDTVSPMY